MTHDTQTRTHTASMALVRTHIHTHASLQLQNACWQSRRLCQSWNWTNQPRPICALFSLKLNAISLSASFPYLPPIELTFRRLSASGKRLEGRTQGRSHIGHHHGRLSALLATLLSLVSSQSHDNPFHPKTCWPILLLISDIGMS